MTSELLFCPWRRGAVRVVASTASTVPLRRIVRTSGRRVATAVPVLDAAGAAARGRVNTPAAATATTASSTADGTRYLEVVMGQGPRYQTAGQNPCVGISGYSEWLAGDRGVQHFAATPAGSYARFDDNQRSISSMPAPLRAA